MKSFIYIFPSYCGSVPACKLTQKHEKFSNIAVIIGSKTHKTTGETKINKYFNEQLYIRSEDKASHLEAGGNLSLYSARNVHYSFLSELEFGAKHQSTSLPPQQSLSK